MDKLIIDADICIKLGASDRFPFLSELIPRICSKSYIHHYVFNEEILTPLSAKKQLNNLIKNNFLEVIDKNALSKVGKDLYQATYKKLSDVMVNPNSKANVGEAHSLAIAKAMSIPVFMTDERNLQPIIDRILNNGLNDIACIRIIDIINKIKCNEICGYSRKQGKAIWVMSGKNKKIFDEEIWPL